MNEIEQYRKETNEAIDEFIKLNPQYSNIAKNRGVLLEDDNLYHQQRKSLKMTERISEKRVL